MTVRVVGVSLAIWLLLSVSLWASGWEPAVLVLGGILVAGSVMIFVAVDLFVGVRRVVWPDPRNLDDDPVVDHERAKVLLGDLLGSAWRGSGRHGPERTDPTDIRETLVGVMDERLRAEHGIVRTAQPEAAAALLTPRLRRLVDGRTPQPTSVSDLPSILSDLEEL